MRLADDLVALGETRSATQLLRLGEVDLARLLRRVLRLARPVARAAGVQIDDASIPAPGAGPLFLGDEGALWSAVDNLVQNAIRHAGEGGEVRVGLWGQGAGGRVVLEIADTGPGMSEEELDIALRPFARPGDRPGAPRRAGGLGLAIARDLIEAHDGRLDIETSPGHGLTACVSFPASRSLPA